ncbi:hypothetical protein C0993_010226 [Termitomyces sp. T159_Od127]|nr:hypothetical protein C0993_010226 [Termitomyces sp. T159_Od127]
MFQAKPLTFQLESSHVAFAALYLQGIAFDHYTALLRFDPNNPVLSNWQAFAQEFLSKFGVFDTVAEAEKNLFNLRMCNNKRFTTFIIRFEKEAYKTGWNYNALRFALCCTLPQRIKDILCLAPKQPSYNSYKALVTQIDQQNSNWQTGAAAGNQTTSTAPPPNSATQLPLGQGPANVNQPLGPHPQMQLNAANMQDTPDPNQADPDLPTDPPDTLDYANNEEALCASRFRNQLWIDVLEETQEKQRREGACILCSEQGHFINECPKCQVVGQAMWTIDALFLDTPLAHLPSQSSQILLLHTTLPHSSAPINTLVNSGTTDNFIDKSLATLATTPQKLPLPIHLTLFDGSSTSAGDITHYVQTTLNFANGQWQDLQLLVTCLHASALLILGLPWLRSTNLHINWQNLTLHFASTMVSDFRSISWSHSSQRSPLSY